MWSNDRKANILKVAYNDVMTVVPNLFRRYSAGSVPHGSYPFGGDIGIVVSMLDTDLYSLKVSFLFLYVCILSNFTFCLLSGS